MTSPALGRASGSCAHISVSSASKAEGSSGGGGGVDAWADASQATEAAAEVGRRPLLFG